MKSKKEVLKFVNSIIFANSISFKRLKILEKTILEAGGHVHLMIRDRYQAKSNSNNCIILANVNFVEDLRGLYPQFLAMNESIDIYSVEWVSKCLEKQKFSPKLSFKIPHSDPTASKLPISKGRRSKRERLESTESLLDPGFLKTNYECLRPTPLDHHNKGLFKVLSNIAYHRYLTGNSRSELSYNKAIAALKIYPQDIKTHLEAQQIL